MKAMRLCSSLRVLIGCECSGRVREAFRRRGHDAWSCDLKGAEDGSSHHIKGDLIAILDDGWDMAVFHPPCTHLARSGGGHFEQKRRNGQQAEALAFVRRLMAVPYPYALENPVSIISTRIRPSDQTIHPWWFGTPVEKMTCLWLRGVPPLRPTRIVTPRKGYIHKMPSGPLRAMNRSRTFMGVAEAMADQWGSLELRPNLIGELELC